MLERLYKQLWARIGGKPWTEFVREDQKVEPLAYMLIFLFMGIMLVKLTGGRWWWVMIGFVLGILAGHFWW